MKPARYTLVVFEPGSRSSRAAFFESSTPFAPISVGEAVHVGGWPKQGSQRHEPPLYLRATEVHHYIGESAGMLRHNVTVYTEEVEAAFPLP